ncbi:hypothetical protein KIL84_002693 [Mauremys mutica]|uniref:Uncharacterized protein n=1 Tax=Mauremys mutica TaxID=74926 RepID=A0A9D3WUC0_9SAUR|nr:hypothetical protein KIL84_002693 [Mauremys mutica]
MHGDAGLDLTWRGGILCWIGHGSDLGQEEQMGPAQFSFVPLSLGLTQAAVAGAMEQASARPIVILRQQLCSQDPGGLGFLPVMPCPPPNGTRGQLDAGGEEWGIPDCSTDST